MAQQRISINGWSAKQPVDFGWSYETTSTEDSGRAMSGTLYDTPMFTVEAFDVSYRDMTISEASALLQHIVKRPSRPYVTLHYFSPYYGNWRDGEFSVSQGSLKVKSLKQGEENIDEISFKLVGRQRIT